MFSRQVCISLYDWFATWILLLAVWIVLTGGEAGPAQAYTNLTLYLLVSRGARGPFAKTRPADTTIPFTGGGFTRESRCFWTRLVCGVAARRTAAASPCIGEGCSLPPQEPRRAQPLLAQYSLWRPGPSHWDSCTSTLRWRGRFARPQCWC
jgi:hypothetical protein